MHKTCLWCRTDNQLPREGKPYCMACGHRADLSRMECDCHSCTRMAAEALTHRQDNEYVGELPEDFEGEQG